MKKLLAMILCLVFIVTCSACSSSSNTVDEEVETPKIEYYPDSTVPTLDSLLDEPLIQGGNGLGYVYGPYDSESEAKSIMREYANALVSEYGFEITEDTYYYGLTDGTHEVMVILGTKNGKDAVGVSVK